MATEQKKPLTVPEISEKMWSGKGGFALVSPEAMSELKNDEKKNTGDLKKPAPPPMEVYEPGLGFIYSLANILMVDTSDGLVLVDTGNYMRQDVIYRRVRDFSKSPLHTAIYTHGHTDHCFGVPIYEKEPSAKKVTVVGHKNVPARFHRYNLTNGYNANINQRQFRMDKPNFPSDFRFPDLLYDDSLVLTVGGVRFELYHAKGETDDATWVYIPKYRAIATGDLFIWAAPNCGNPQKVQRYPKHWAEALRLMQGKRAKYLFPGHGAPIVGEDRVDQALSETAEYLESLVSQTLTLMNKGCTLDHIIHTVKPPAHLLSRPYLTPSYDEPEFIVRNIWRLYAGWWDFDFANLKPATHKSLGSEITSLSGGPKALATRAEELVKSDKDDDRRLACHLIEYARQAVDSDPKYATSDERKLVHKTRINIYTLRNKKETSLMGTGVFRGAILQSDEILKKLDPQPKAKL